MQVGGLKITFKLELLFYENLYFHMFLIICLCIFHSCLVQNPLVQKAFKNKCLIFSILLINHSLLPVDDLLTLCACLTRLVMTLPLLPQTYMVPLESPVMRSPRSVCSIAVRYSPRRQFCNKTYKIVKHKVIDDSHTIVVFYE